MSDELVLVQNLIHEIRGKKVMLDYDLARLYQIETKALKQAVRRNMERFPPDFMFTLSQDEYNVLKINIRSHFVTFEESRGKYPKYPPFAFTQEGIAMLSSVLRSDIAIGQLAEKLEEKKNVPVSRIGFKQASAQHQEGVTAG